MGQGKARAVRGARDGTARRGPPRRNVRPSRCVRERLERRRQGKKTSEAKRAAVTFLPPRLFSLDLVVEDVLDADDAPGDSRPGEVVHSQHRAPLVFICDEAEALGGACERSRPAEQQRAVRSARAENAWRR